MKEFSRKKFLVIITILSEENIITTNIHLT